MTIPRAPFCQLLKILFKSKGLSILFLCACLTVRVQAQSWRGDYNALSTVEEKVDFLVEAYGSPQNDVKQNEEIVKLLEQLKNESDHAFFSFCKLKFNLHLYKKSEIDSAQKYVDIAFARLKDLPNVELVADFANKQMTINAFMFNNKGILDTFEQYKTEIEQGNDKRSFLRSVNYLAIALSESNPDSALKVADLGISKSIEFEQTDMLIFFTVNKSSLYPVGKQVDVLKLAIPYVKEGTQGYAELYKRIGYQYRNSDSNLDSALFYLLKAEESAEFLDANQRVELFTLIADYFQSEKEHELALDYFRKPLSVNNFTSFPTGQVALANMVFAHTNLNNIDSAGYYLALYKPYADNSSIEYLRLLYWQAKGALTELTDEPCSTSLFEAYFNVIEYSLRTDNLRHNSFAFSQVLPCLNNGIIKPTAENFALISMAADKYYNFPVSDNNEFIKEVFFPLYADFLKKNGQTQKAFEVYAKLTSVLKDLNEKSYQRGKNESLEKYKAELKDAEIELLQLKNQNARQTLYLVGFVLSVFIVLFIFIFYLLNRTKQAKQLLQVQNEKIEGLLREIHHRVKNNLQIMQSFINLQKDKVEDNPVSLQILNDTSNRIIALANLHSSLYQQEGHTKIEIGEYLKSLCENLKINTPENISIVCKTDTLNMATEKVIPLGLAVTEAITNAVKYAFNNGSKGQVSIALTTEQNIAKLNIIDNGVGIPNEYLKGKQGSIGILLIKDIAHRYLNGKISIDSEQGTNIEIEFQV
jgi:two-component sensor histidine kinase